MSLVGRRVALGVALVLVAILIGVGLGLVLPGRDNTFVLEDNRSKEAAAVVTAERLQLPGEMFVRYTPAAIWVDEHPTDPRVDVIADSVANQPTGSWFYNWDAGLTERVQDVAQDATRIKAVPVIVTYDESVNGCDNPLSDVGNADAYLKHTDAIAQGVGEATAVLVMDPSSLDGVFNTDCVSTVERKLRLDAMTAAVDRFQELSPSALVYLGAGPFFYDKDADAESMAQRLDAAGLSAARGFAVNVRDYRSNEEMMQFADAINATLEADFGYRKPYVIDSSRNGAPIAEGCNPKNARLGELPRATGPEEGPEMFLWIASPGESDGDCGMAPDTEYGEFLPEIAASLARGR